MIINDLQYIETATETEVEGGYYYYPSYTSEAGATSTGSASAYGDYKAYTSSNLYALADSNFGFSTSGGTVTAYAESKKYYY